MRGNPSEIAPARKSFRCDVNTPSVNVKGYFQVRANLRINRDEISDEMDRIVELLNVRTECRFGYTHKK